MGETLEHAMPRTVTEGDVALYKALCGPRFALQSSDEFARQVGLPCAPVDDLLTFNLVLGQSTSDVAANAGAHRGCRHACFGAAVYPGDTLTARSTVTGLAPGSDSPSGAVYFDTVGVNQDGAPVLSVPQRIEVSTREGNAPCAATQIPSVAETVDPSDMSLPLGLRVKEWSYVHARAPHRWGDYAPGEIIDHGSGVTPQGAEHKLASRLLGSVSAEPINPHVASDAAVVSDAMSGGYLFSLARSLSYRGLENTFGLLAINGVEYCNPMFAGDTLYASTEVLERFKLPGVEKVGALRLRLVATKNRAPCTAPTPDGNGRSARDVVLHVDYVAAVPV